MLKTEEKESIEKASTLESSIKRVIKFVDGLPPQYKEKTFEKLLEYVTSKTFNDGQTHSDEGWTFQKYNVSVVVRAFLDQFDIPEKTIHKQFIITGPEEITPKYKLKAGKFSQKQIHTALLLALENALVSGKFEFSVRELEDRCKDNGSHEANFTSNLKTWKKLFASLADPDHVPLSPVGKEHLADLLDELSNKAW